MDALIQTDWNVLFQLGLPFLLTTGGALVLVLLSISRNKSLAWPIFLISEAVLVLAFVFAWQEWYAGSTTVVSMLLFDRMAYAFDMILLLGAILSLILAKDYLIDEKMPIGEYFALILFSLTGAMLIAHAADLIVLFLGLEIMSLAAYILAGLKKDSVRSYESSLKYFLLGAFASGFLLHGITLTYGAAGSTAFSELQKLTLPPAEPILVLLAVAMLLIGIGFKIAAVPFHTWSPDVYEGAPTSVTAFMASVIKTAGFAALIRIVIALGHLPEIPWVAVLSILAALTMTVGNLGALRQTNIKRMLAYSSIAHAGYALVGITAAVQKNALTESTLGAVIFYLFSYSLMTLGAFAVVIAVSRRGDSAEEMFDYDGLATKHPALAASMAIILISLTGIPPTIGFIGKFYLFAGAVESGLYGLVIIGVLNSVISAWYYLGPVVRMYFRPERDYRIPPISYTLMVGLFLSLFVILYIGLMPSDLFIMARESVRELIF